MNDPVTIYPHHRITPKGAMIAAHRTIFGNARLVWFKHRSYSVYSQSRGWLYPDLDSALWAMDHWDADNYHRPPDGWTRETHSGLNRPGGDPALEYYGPITYAVPAELRRSHGEIA